LQTESLPGALVLDYEIIIDILIWISIVFQILIYHIIRYISYN
jgi:hypothetical protein